MNRVKYTRKEINENCYIDPTDTINNANIWVVLSETPFWFDKIYLAKIETEKEIDIAITDMNNVDWFVFVKMTDQKALALCNDNIAHGEGEEFTLEWEEIVDNRDFTL